MTPNVASHILMLTAVITAFYHLNGAIFILLLAIWIKV